MVLEQKFLTAALQDEFRIWQQWLAPKLDLPANVLSICQYGFTEMLNNAIDHSQSKNVLLRY